MKLRFTTTETCGRNVAVLNRSEATANNAISCPLGGSRRFARVLNLNARYLSVSSRFAPVLNLNPRYLSVSSRFAPVLNLISPSYPRSIFLG